MLMGTSSCMGLLWSSLQPFVTVSWPPYMIVIVEQRPPSAELGRLCIVPA